MDTPPPASPAPGASSPASAPRRYRIAAQIPTADIQHPADREALESLRQIAGLDDVIRYLFEYGFERLERISNLSSAVKVSDRQFPDLYRRYRRCVRRVGVYPEPPLYVRGGAMNAMTGGVERPYIVLTSGLINAATPAELDHVIGHELGHIRCQHALYGTLARLVPVMAEQIPVVGRLIGGGLSLALMEWARRAELSCDRFGLLCSQDREASLRVHVKLAGAPYLLYDQISIDAFLAQHEEFETLDKDRLSALYKILAQSNMTHPWLVVRAHTLHRWHADGEYDKLLDGAPEEPEEAVPAPARAVPAYDLPGAIARMAQIAKPAALWSWLAAGPRPPRILICGEERRGWGRLPELLAVPGAEVRGLPIGHDDLAVELEVAERLVVPVWASQLLSSAERDFLRQRASGFGGGVWLLVMGLDEVAASAQDGAEQVEELRRRLRRFVERLPFPAQVAESPEALRQALAAEIDRLHPEAGRRWRARLRVALMAMPTEGQPAPLDAQILEEESDLALVEARSDLTGALAELRAGLGARLDALGDRVGSEGPALAEAEIHRISREVSARYLSALERRIQGRASAGLSSALRGGALQGAPGADPGQKIGDAPRPSPLPPRDPLRAALAVGGVLALLGVAGPGWPLAAGAALLLGANELGRQQRMQLRKAVRGAVQADLEAWLDEAEGALREGLEQLGAEVAGQLRARLAELHGAGPEALALRAWLIDHLDQLDRAEAAEAAEAAKGAERADG